MSVSSRLVLPVERRLYLIRHAEAATIDDEGRVHSDQPVPLTARGRGQAAALAWRLSRAETSKVHASDLARAAETAQILADGREVVLHEGLREVSLGELEGRSTGEISSTGFLVDPDVGLPGGESFTELVHRVRREVESILQAERDRETVIVAHGGVNRAVIAGLLHLPGRQALRLRQDWCCLNVLEEAEGRWWLGVVNWTPGGLEEVQGRQVWALGSEEWRRLGDV